MNGTTSSTAIVGRVLHLMASERPASTLLSFSSNPLATKLKQRVVCQHCCRVEYRGTLADIVK